MRPGGTVSEWRSVRLFNPRIPARSTGAPGVPALAHPSGEDRSHSQARRDRIRRAPLRSPGIPEGVCGAERSARRAIRRRPAHRMGRPDAVQVFWGEGHTSTLPNPFDDFSSAERTFVAMTSRRLPGEERLAVNTQPDISNVGNRRILAMAIQAGAWLRWTASSSKNQFKSINWRTALPGRRPSSRTDIFAGPRTPRTWRWTRAGSMFSRTTCCIRSI